jgi:hypothetical protein
MARDLFPFLQCHVKAVVTELLDYFLFEKYVSSFILL